MSIEFRCTGCGKLLRTPDSTAGRQAKCPQCGALIMIPAAPSGQLTSPPAVPPPPPPPFPPPDDETLNPFQSPQASTMSAAETTPYGPLQPGTLDVADVLGRTWQLLTSRPGMCFGVPATAAVIGFAAGQTWNHFYQPPVPLAAHAGEWMFWFVGLLPLMVLRTYLAMGVLQILLKVVRGHACSFVELFLAGPQFLPFLVTEILYSLLVSAGACLCIVPAVFLIMMFFLTPMLVLDQRVPVMDSFGVSKKLTDAHWANLFLLGLVVFGLSMVSTVPFFVCFQVAPTLAPIVQLVGIIIVSPYIALLYVVVYRTLAGDNAATTPTDDQPGNPPAWTQSSPFTPVDPR